MYHSCRRENREERAEICIRFCAEDLLAVVIDQHRTDDSSSYSPAQSPGGIRRILARGLPNESPLQHGKLIQKAQIIVVFILSFFVYKYL